MQQHSHIIYLFLHVKLNVKETSEKTERAEMCFQKVVLGFRMTDQKRVESISEEINIMH
jgi:hypothetical protein